MKNSTDAKEDNSKHQLCRQALLERVDASDIDAARMNSRNPLRDGAIAGFKTGLAGIFLSGGAVTLSHRAGVLGGTPALRVWLVAIGGMAGFFVASEKAVVAQK